MEIEGKSLRRRVLAALFMTFVLFAVSAAADGHPTWTLVAVGPPLFFVFEVVADVLLGRIRDWRAA